MSLPLDYNSLREYESWNALRWELYTLGCQGIEGIFGGDPLPHDFPHELISGYHLIFYQDWLDFWREDTTALIKKYGSKATISSIYGGLDPQLLLDQYRDDLMRAASLQVPYVVFHVTDVSVEECFTYRWLHSDREVVEAAVEVINQLLRGRDWPFTFLVENQWWPGFRFTDPGITQYLLDHIDFPKKGIMLDTGHLMNCCPSLTSQAEGAAFISRMLAQHGSLASVVQGLHLHQSLSGPYVANHTGKLPTPWPSDYMERFSRNYAHVLHIDQHLPWSDPSICPVVEQINPRFLTHELTSRSRAQRRRDVLLQQQTLGLRPIRNL